MEEREIKVGDNVKITKGNYRGNTARVSKVKVGLETIMAYECNVFTHDRGKVLVQISPDNIELKKEKKKEEHAI
ncbi:hypothetical protein [Ekhidna sp.]